MCGKIIITCAVTGSICTPTMSPRLPITPNEIAEGAIAACEAGASVVHFHARDPQTGAPTPDPDSFMQFLPRIRRLCNAVINLTTGGGRGHVRVGLENSLYISWGKLSKSTAEKVVKVRRILEGLSLEIATPDEARAMPALMSHDRVEF